MDGSVCTGTEYNDLGMGLDGRICVSSVCYDERCMVMRAEAKMAIGQVIALELKHYANVGYKSLISLEREHFAQHIYLEIPDSKLQR